MFIIKKINNLLKKNEIIKRWYFLYLNRNNKDSSLYKWIKCDGDRTLRMNYPLNENSIVFDMGGYEGAWADDIYKKYGSDVYVFEPVPAFANNIKNKFNGNYKVKVYTFGLSDKTEDIDLGLSDNGSSAFIKSDNFIKIHLVKSSDFIRENNITKIDLIKLNIEGGEYSLLEDLIESDFVKNISNIQVQFHRIPNSDIRMQNIQKNLDKTHKLTYQFPYLWENWTLINNLK